jgi:hypothetical protein
MNIHNIILVSDNVLQTNPHFIPGECAQSTTNGNATEENGHRRRVAMRCYCLLTRFPFFKLHFKVLYKLIGKIISIAIVIHNLKLFI